MSEGGGGRHRQRERERGGGEVEREREMEGRRECISSRKPTFFQGSARIYTSSYNKECVNHKGIALSGAALLHTKPDDCMRAGSTLGRDSAALACALVPLGGVPDRHS